LCLRLPASAATRKKWPSNVQRSTTTSNVTSVKSNKLNVLLKAQNAVAQLSMNVLKSNAQISKLHNADHVKCSSNHWMNVVAKLLFANHDQNLSAMNAVL
jgi:hypothetical protein